jgi:hypothetical protein
MFLYSKPTPTPKPCDVKNPGHEIWTGILTAHCMQLRPMDVGHYQNKGPTQGRSKVTNPSLHITSLFFLIPHRDNSVTENKPSPSYDAFLHQCHQPTFNIQFLSLIAIFSSKFASSNYVGFNLTICIKFCLQFHLQILPFD